MERKVTVIPAKPREEIHKASKRLRVAAYCRVSTDQEDQLHSFDAQVNYYTDYINGHEGYELAGIYADEGISGTNTKKREDFKRMIRDCEDGKIDLVITKSISRFARNTQDCLSYSRALKQKGIGIIFEKENINTLDASGELLFTILSSLAQDESRNISENCKWGIRSKFREGKLHIDATTFLGYDKDEDGKLIINEEQAKVVKRIYHDFLWGRNPQQIASDLEEEGVKNGRGNTKWYPSNIIGILKNEKHKGDALLQKTYTADFLTKRQVKNKGEITQFYVEDSHEGIIDKETWQAVQEELERREAFMAEHGLKKYSYNSPFSNRVFCGKCGSPYNRHSWSTRNKVQWQCTNHRHDGVMTCDNHHVFESVLEEAFVKAFNSLYHGREKGKDRTPLERLRHKQMQELLREPPLKCFVPELAQLVLEKVIVLGEGSFEFHFLDGSVRKM